MVAAHEPCYEGNKEHVIAGIIEQTLLYIKLFNHNEISDKPVNVLI